MSRSPGEESPPLQESKDLKLFVHRIHSLNSECESGYDDTPSECDIKEVGYDDTPSECDIKEVGYDEDEVLVANTETDNFTDEGRESVETGEGMEELEEDTLVSTAEINSRPESRDNFIIYPETRKDQIGPKQSLFQADSPSPVVVKPEEAEGSKVPSSVVDDSQKENIDLQRIANDDGVPTGTKTQDIHLQNSKTKIHKIPSSGVKPVLQNKLKSVYSPPPNIEQLKKTKPLENSRYSPQRRPSSMGGVIPSSHSKDLRSAKGLKSSNLLDGSSSPQRVRTSSQGLRSPNLQEGRNASSKGLRSPNFQEGRNASSKGLRSPNLQEGRRASSKGLRSPNLQDTRSATSKALRSPNLQEGRSASSKGLRSPSLQGSSPRKLSPISQVGRRPPPSSQRTKISSTSPDGRRTPNSVSRSPAPSRKSPAPDRRPSCLRRKSSKLTGLNGSMSRSVVGLSSSLTPSPSSASLGRIPKSKSSRDLSKPKNRSGDQLCSRGCGTPSLERPPNFNHRGSKPIQLWEIQRTLGRGDFIEGVLNVDFSNGFDNYICAPIKLGRSDGHLDAVSHNRIK